MPDLGDRYARVLWLEAEVERLQREIADVLGYYLSESHPAYARLYAALNKPAFAETGAVRPSDSPFRVPSAEPPFDEQEGRS